MQRFFIKIALIIGLIAIIGGSQAYAHPVLPEAVMNYIWTHPRATDAEIDAWLKANPEYNQDDTHEMMTMFRDLTDEQIAELQGKDSVLADSTERQSALQRFFGFIWQGILHILKGPDHVLFVLSLLLIPLGAWRLIKLLSTFTIAHSITLLLAGFGIITVPSTIVEPIIALSITATAVGALLYYAKGTDRFIKHRHTIVFLFGLFHGLGFASVFGELGIQNSNIVLPLLAFNLGVEVGQIAIVAAMQPAFATIASTAYRKNVYILASAGMIIASLYWFLTRIGF
jgi:HupE / UreJ protein